MRSHWPHRPSCQGRQTTSESSFEINCLRMVCRRRLDRLAGIAASNADECVYLFTSFQNNGEKGLQFLHSKDGCTWTRVPGYFLKPRVGTGKLMRDPSLLRGPDGTFHLVWTTGWKNDQGFGYSQSKDLLHWSEQRFISVMAHEPTTVNVWARNCFTISQPRGLSFAGLRRFQVGLPTAWSRTITISECTTR